MCVGVLALEDPCLPPPIRPPQYSTRSWKTLQRDDIMKSLISPIVCLICCLLVAGAQQAKAKALSGVAPRRDASERPHSGTKAAASKKTKTPSQKSASAGAPPRHEDLPCPRATWKDDPVCADAPDEHTLPTPSAHSAVPQHSGGAPKVQVPGAENLSVGVDWQGNNNPRLPGYDSVPMP
jgi:hypothetical protein